MIFFAYHIPENKKKCIGEWETQRKRVCVCGGAERIIYGVRMVDWLHFGIILYTLREH